MKADLCQRIDFSPIGEASNLSPGEQADTSDKVTCRVTLTDKKANPQFVQRLDLVAQTFSSAEGAQTAFNKGAAKYDGEMRGDKDDVQTAAEAARYYRGDKAGYSTIAVDANLYLDMKFVPADPAYSGPRLVGEWALATKLLNQVVTELRRDGRSA
ncbi:hypothetical protein [Rhizocola hellebori]|nr:hypothetical protein [Rhizocola hellebori]